MARKRVPVAKSTADLRSSAVAANASRDEILKAMTFTAREESAVAPAPDEADQVWMGVGAVIPPYEPFVLLTLLEHSNSLRQCIDAYVTNIDAFGHRFDPVIDLTASDADDRIKQYIKSREAEKNPGLVADPTRQVPEPGEEQVSKVRAELIERMREELLQIQHFFEYACLNESFVSLRRKTRQDIETMGNAYWECIKSTDGKLAGFEYVPGFTVRHMPADRHATTVQMKVKKDLFNYTEIEGKRHFRRFVQVFETRTIWFKEFGDPRVVSRKDGAYFAKVEDLKKRDTNDEPASEIFHFSVHSSKSSYGIPRWIGTILSVLGSRQAEEVNHSYFENKSVPPLAVLVSGGRISQSTVDRIKEFIENDIKGKRNFHKILVLEAESPGTSGFDQGRMKIDLKPLTAAQHNDALFQTYDQNNIDKVGMAFRLPRMLRGDIRDFNRSTADAAIEFAEQQVFKPERDEFDFMMNRKVLPTLGIRFWKFRSNAVEGHTATELGQLLSQLGEVGFITPAEGRDLMEKIFNRPFQKIDAPWVRQPLALTTAGIVPPDQLMAPNMTTPQSAATGAQAMPGEGIGGAVMQGPQAPPPGTGEAAAGKVTLTGTDIATVTTVNEARAGMGLHNLKTKDGQDDPDGFLTVAEFKAKRIAQGQTVGTAQGQAASGITPTGQTTPDSGAQKDGDMVVGDLANGGLNIGGLPRRRRDEEKAATNPMLTFVRDLMMLKKAMDIVEGNDAEAAFNDAVDFEILFEVNGEWTTLDPVAKAKGRDLTVEHADGSRTTTSHGSKAAAQRAAAAHLKENGGSGKLVITPPGNPHGAQPLPAKIGGGGGQNCSQYGCT